MRLLPIIHESANADAIDFSIKTITTSNFTEIEPPSSGITIIVGANNSGKSTFLREIVQTLKFAGSLPLSRRLIKDITLGKNGSPEDVIAWLALRETYTQRGTLAGFVDSDGNLIQENVVIHLWSNGTNNQVPAAIGQLASFFVHYATATNRASSISPRERRANISEPPLNAMLKLEDSPDLMQRVRELSERIFQQPLTLDPLSNNVQLRVGETSVPVPPVNAVTKEYRDAIIELEPLQEQGDGMTAVLGLLVPILCDDFPIAIVDEPEAFLHPPQANLVGKVLGELCQEHNLQMFLATHDRNMLVGLLQSDAPTTIIRLDRRAEPTMVHKLDHQRVQDLWDEPVLRYSNVLDGLFHRAVILCEAERDCTFYAASLDELSNQEDLPFSPADILFIPAGGKDGFPAMIKALNAVSVPVVAVPDFDLLNDSGKTRTLIEAMNGSWKQYQHNYDIATQPFRTPRTPVINAQVLNLIESLLQGSPNELYGSETEKKIKAAIRAGPSPWEDLKKYGQHAFKGRAGQAVNNLVNDLGTLGIAIVRDGELECLGPTVVSRKGSAWLSEALDKKIYAEEPAQKHIRYVAQAIKRRMTDKA